MPDYAQHVLESVGGNQRQAAALKFMCVVGGSHLRKEQKALANAVRCIQFSFSAESLSKALDAMDDSKLNVAVCKELLDSVGEDEPLRPQYVKDLTEAEDVLQKTPVLHHIAPMWKAKVKLDKNAAGRPLMKWLDWPGKPSVRRLDGKQFVDAFVAPTASSPIHDRDTDSAPLEANEWARLFHTLSSTRAEDARRRMPNKATRADLDEEKVCPWADIISPIYNDSAFIPQANDKLCNGVVRSEIDGLDPSKLIRPRSGQKLKSKFGEMRGHYTIVHAIFTKSGQNDGNALSDFTNSRPMGSRVLIYFHAYAQTNEGSVFLGLTLKSVDLAAAREGGISGFVPPTQIPTARADPNQGERSARRKRSRNNDGSYGQPFLQGCENFGRGTHGESISRHELRSAGVKTMRTLTESIEEDEDRLDSLGDLPEDASEAEKRKRARKVRRLEANIETASAMLERTRGELVA